MIGIMMPSVRLHHFRFQSYKILSSCFYCTECTVALQPDRVNHKCSGFLNSHSGKRAINTTYIILGRYITM
jgi:hypothetical protein